MREIIQLIVSFTGSLGFAALFNIHGKKLWFAALGGCLSWAVYLAVEFVTPSPYVCRYDVDDHCFSDGLAVDVQAETDVSV